MTATDLVRQAWEESNHSDDLFDITSRLEEYAMVILGSKIKSDRVYMFLDNMGLHSTNKVVKILNKIKESN